MARAGLTGVFEQHPNRQTISFGTKAINLSALARQVSASPAHMSKVFSGVTLPSLKLTRTLSQALDMTVDEFLNALDFHTDLRKSA